MKSFVENNRKKCSFIETKFTIRKIIIIDNSLNIYVLSHFSLLSYFCGDIYLMILI